MSEIVRVVMKTTSAGPEGVRLAGEVVEVNQAEAAALIAGHFAEPVDASADSIKQLVKKPGARSRSPKPAGVVNLEQSDVPVDSESTSDGTAA